MTLITKFISQFGFGKSTRKVFATGGKIAIGNDNTYHIFDSPGDFIVNYDSDVISEVECFIVGGGGGAYIPNGGGGGGGGGVSVAVTTVTKTSYPITIGAGGNNSNGGQSSCFVFNVPGGGRGGYLAPTSGAASGGPGSPGSSGGGGGSSYTPCAVGNISAPGVSGGTGTSGIGYPGGSAQPSYTGPFSFLPPPTQPPNCGSFSNSGGGGGAGGSGTPGGPNYYTPNPALGGAGIDAPANFVIPIIASVMPPTWASYIATYKFGSGGNGYSPSVPPSSYHVNTGSGGNGRPAPTNPGSPGIIIIRYSNRIGINTV